MSATDKRKIPEATNGGDDSDDSSDDDFGPTPDAGYDPSAVDLTAAAAAAAKPPVKKKKRHLEFEKVFAENLPSSDSYEFSLMHRDVVTHIVVSKPTEFIITASLDGHVKFWKKMSKTIEFAKHFQAHLGAINAMVLSPDSLKLVTTSQDKMIKFFEVGSFDMANMISVQFTPTAACWLPGGVEVAVADATSGSIFIFRSADGTQAPSQELKLHSATVVAMAASSLGVIVSADQRGMLEYWDASTLEFPVDKVAFSMKTETDLYDLVGAAGLSY